MSKVTHDAKRRQRTGQVIGAALALILCSTSLVGCLPSDEEAAAKSQAAIESKAAKESQKAEAKAQKEQEKAEKKARKEEEKQRKAEEEAAAKAAEQAEREREREQQEAAAAEEARRVQQQAAAEASAKAQADAAAKQNQATTPRGFAGSGSAPGGEVFYANCKEVRNAGKAPLHSGDPGYSYKLDRDRDGIACE